MIKKIKSIKNFAVFEDFNWNNSVKNSDGSVIEFQKLNILYGRNYSGKTTLSRIFRAIETRRLPDNYDEIEFEVEDDQFNLVTQSNLASFEGKIRVFNEDFVREHLKFLVDPAEEIEPFAILGAENAKIQERIDLLEKEIGSNEEGKETGLYKLAKDAEENRKRVEKEWTTASKSYDIRLTEKATDRKIGIKYDPERFGDQNYNRTKLNDDIKCVLSDTYLELSSEQKDTYEKVIKENVKTAVKTLIPEDINYSKFCSEAQLLLSRKIGSSNKIKELLVDVALNEWVKQGAVLLEGKNICAFCGNPISDNRWSEIHSHFDEESKKLEEELQNLILAIKCEEEKLSNPFNLIKQEDFYQTYIKDFQDFLNKREAYLIAYKDALKSITDQLEKRKRQITISIDFIKPQFNEKLLNSIVSDFNKIIDENNNYADSLGVKKRQAQKALRLDEVSGFCKTIKITDLQENIAKLEDEKKNATDLALKLTIELSKKRHELEKTKRQLNDEEEGARRVNQYLNHYFGHRFITLVAESVEDEEKRIRFKIMRGDKPAYNLSEGECSLIAFCYFIAKLEDIDTFNEKTIIWIDDPISSLDSNHIYFIYSLLSSQIADKNNCEQLFVSTHNLDFLKYLKRLKFKTDTSKQYLLVERLNKISDIKKLPNYLKENATEFNYLFSIIYKCSQCTSVTDENYDMLFSFGNNARKFLEMYLYFKYPMPSKDETENLKKFFAPDEVPPILINRMLNERSHGTSPERMMKIDIEPETINVAKKIIDKLKQDRDQYNALLKSIGVIAE
ncbi:MAG: AAA family ATPase [Clostridiales bacterium]|nr:AAA family ATPase [Clostridiales bacterium]